MGRLKETDPAKDFSEERLQLETEDALVDPETAQQRLDMALDAVSPFSEKEMIFNRVESFLEKSEMFNRQNPRSLFSLLPEGLADILMKGLKKNPELLEMYIERDDLRFEKLSKPTMTDNLLRMSFWNEYYRAQNQGDKMLARYIYEAVCPKEHFYSLIQRPHKVMWILTPPPDQTAQMEVLLAKGIRRLDEILSLPITRNGKIDTKVANLIMKTAIVLDVRLKGQAVQKVEVTNKHEIKMSAEEIDKKLRELEKEEADIKTISVNPSPDKAQDMFATLAEYKEVGKF